MSQREITAAVRVWFAATDPLLRPGLRDGCLGLLSEQERGRYQGLRFERDRAAYLAAHAMLRLCLAPKMGLAPERLRFGLGSQGKPFVHGAGSLAPVQFNLSHAHHVVACVISEAGPCGIDVEQTRDAPELNAVANSVFTDEERACLARQEPQRRLTHFFDLWSLKEAYLKALGVGLLGDTRRASFAIGSEGVRADVRDEAGWQFHLQAVEPDHRIAVAVRGDVDWPPVISRFEW